VKSNSRYYNTLTEEVVELSDSKSWDYAVLEWEIFDCEEDEDLMSSCICGKENLRYLFTIRNTRNGNLLFPIGSSCIRKFERPDLNENVTIMEQLFKLLHAFESNAFITLSGEFFSRKLLHYFYEEGVFKATAYNRYSPENDYTFLLQMFNKQDKSTISLAQKKKINALIMSSIRPFLRKLLQDKVRSKK